MFQHYYYNENIDNRGNHEVHSENCSYLPSVQNRIYIGYEADCHAAMRRAKNETGKSNFDGCYHCCYPCHTG